MEIVIKREDYENVLNDLDRSIDKVRELSGESNGRTLKSYSPDRKLTELLQELLFIRHSIILMADDPYELYE